MKILNFYPLLVFILFTFLLGCSEFIDKYKSTWEYEYEQRVNKSLQKKSTNSSLFLNFELGMTEQTFKFHERTMAQKRILSPNEVDSATAISNLSKNIEQYKFDLNLKSGTYKVIYKPIFEAGKLVQLNLEIQPKIIGSNLTKLYHEVLQLFRRKYGHAFLEKKQVFGSNDFFWFEASKQIKLSESLTTVNVSYSDLEWLDLSLESSDANLLNEQISDTTAVLKYL